MLVKEKITVILEVAQEKEIRQSLWILLDNNRSNIRMRAIYVPQENVTSNNELKIMYNQQLLKWQQMRTKNIVHLNLKKQKNILRPQCNTTKAKPCNSNRKQKKNRIITKCGYKKYSNKLRQKQVSGIFKKDTVQVSYDKWSEEVQSNIKEVQKIFR